MLRRARTIILLLFLGAIVNVAVAWILAVNVNVFDGGQPTEWHQIRDPQFFWLGQCKRRTGGVWIAARFVRIGRNDLLDLGEYQSEFIVPEWTYYHQLTPHFEDPEVHDVWRWGDGRGWPLISFWSEPRMVIGRGNGYDDYVGETLPPQGGFKTSFPEWGGGNPHNTQPRVLPYRPIWPNVLINTLFYAAILLILFCGPGKVRRFMRIRRGRCPKCGYPIGRSPTCTECGANVAR